MNPTETQTTSGGSKATDFQPPTGNPQGNVGGGLQPNSAALQPTTTNGSNVFNQPGVNAQAFPQTSSLRVLQPNSSAAVGADQPAYKPASPSLGGWLWAVIIVVVLVGIYVLLMAISRSANKPGQILATKAPEVLPPKKIKPTKKPKSKPRKKTTKKRK